MQQKKSFLEKYTDFIIMIAILAPLFSISLLTTTLNAPDVGDYTGVAKFFAGSLNAKIRSSHSYLYGLIHFPLVSLEKGFILFKITTFFYLTLLILSLYYLIGKNRKIN